MPASSKNSIESILEKEGFYLFTGNGDSMRPLIREGIDTVEIRPVDASLKVGDVILFRNEDIYVLHRIMEIKGKYLVTLGDNNVMPETVAADKVAGIMTGLWRGEKQVLLTSLRYRTYTALRLQHPFLFKVLKRLMKGKRFKVTGLQTESKSQSHRHRL